MIQEIMDGRRIDRDDAGALGVVVAGCEEADTSFVRPGASGCVSLFVAGNFHIKFAVAPEAIRHRHGVRLVTDDTVDLTEVGGVRIAIG